LAHFLRDRTAVHPRLAGGRRFPENVARHANDAREVRRLAPHPLDLNNRLKGGYDLGGQPRDPLDMRQVVILFLSNTCF
jgi:hypothetical protein